MKKSILVWFALLATMMTAHATAVYEAKALMTPQVRAYAFAPLDSVQQHTIKVDLDKFIEIPDGATVTLNDTLRRFGEPGNDLISDVLNLFSMEDEIRYVIVGYQGAEYAVEPQDLVFSEAQSTAGEKDYLKKYFTPDKKRMWYSPYPFYLIFALLLAAWICALFGTFTGKYVGSFFLILSGILTILASALEMVGVFRMGTDLFWWLGINRYGVWTSCIRAVPLLVAAWLQFKPIGLFSKALSKYFCQEESQEITIRPIVKAIIYCTIAWFVLIILISSYTGSRWVLPILSLILCYGIMGWLIFRQMGEYQKFLGKKIGFVFTIYATMWALTSIISFVFYALGVLKVVLPVILAIATIGLAFMMLNTVMSTPMGATQTVWRDAEGGIHNNSVDCDSANRRIAERRAGGM